MANTSNTETKKFTMECIVTALLELLQEKSYDKISLSEIALRAGVSRNAIYRNFESKDMILRKYTNGITHKFIGVLKSTQINSYNDYLNLLIDHLYSHREIARILYKSELINILLEAFMQMKGAFNTDTAVKEYYENFRIGGVFFIYMTWIGNGCKENKEQLTHIMENVLTKDSVIPTFREPSGNIN